MRHLSDDKSYEMETYSNFFGEKWVHDSQKTSPNFPLNMQCREMFSQFTPAMT